MTTYHRGRKQSLYRKHSFATAISSTSTSTTTRVPLHGSPADGLTLIKSVRAVVLIPALTGTNTASGWIAYARSSAADSAPNFDIDQSDVFGVQNWVQGNKNDQLLDLPLKGITLGAGEAWHLVMKIMQRFGSGSTVMVWQGLYAIRTTDST